MRRIASLRKLLLVGALTLVADQAWAAKYLHVRASYYPGCGSGEARLPPQGTFVTIGTKTQAFNSKGYTLYTLPAGDYKVSASSTTRASVRLVSAAVTRDQVEPGALTGAGRGETNPARLAMSTRGAAPGPRASSVPNPGF
jgi:hypothetical protein